MTGRDFLSVADLSAEELGWLLDEAASHKAGRRRGSALAGRHVALIFEKPSTRTRVSFEVAVASLGGHPVVLRADELQLGRGETIEDTARALERYVDALVVRTFEQERLQRLAAAADIPVVNALSDHEHPCQALADLLTVRERFGRLEGVALAYLGDGNNVAHSLLLAGAMAGMDVRVASPASRAPDPAVVEAARTLGAASGGRVTVTGVVAEAAHGARVLYTDVWASMGFEHEAEVRQQELEHYRLDAGVLELAADDAIVMHCLPAHRGEEITAEVIDGPASVVFDQAENRLHTAKALLAALLG